MTLPRTRRLLRRFVSQFEVTTGEMAPPEPTCPIGWKPSVFKPVFYGYTDTRALFPLEAIPAATTASEPAARAGEGESTLAAGRDTHAIGQPVRIFYPSLDGSPEDAPMLTSCGRYPLVVLAHGECIGDGKGHYKKWFELPATLARSGYVVMVPQLGGSGPGTTSPDQEIVEKLVTWARADWSGRGHLMPAPATALVGHSNGGGNTSRVVAESPGRFSAFVSLSGVALGPVHQTAVPKLFMAGGASFPVEVIGVPLSGGVSSLAPPAHYVLFHQGGHWDYLPPGRTDCEQGMRGSCTWASQVAADMVACFLTRYLRPEGVPFVSIGPFDFFRIDRSLRPPRFWRLLLEDDQEFFAGGHMIAWDLVDGREACALTSEWKAGGEQGSLVHA